MRDLTVILRKSVDRRPTWPCKAPRLALVQSPKCNDGHLRMARKLPEADRPKRGGVRMRLGGKNRRKHQRIRRDGIGPTDFAQIVCGGDPDEIAAARVERARRAIYAPSPPFACGDCAICQNGEMPLRSCDLRQPVKFGAARLRRQVIVAIDEPQATPCATQHLIERIRVALIRQQPDIG